MALAYEHAFAGQFLLGPFARVEMAEGVELGAGGKSIMSCIWPMNATWSLRSGRFAPLRVALT